MGAFWYLWKRTIINKIKKALKKPATYIFGVFFIGYCIFILATLGSVTTNIGIDNPEGMAAALTLLVFISIPSSIISFVKRKGLLFSPSDVHMIFPAPTSPKRVLLFAHSKNILVSLVLGIFLVIAGYFWCNISFVLMILYYIFACVIEEILESSMMIILYGNEFMSKRIRKAITILMYLFMGMFVLIGAMILWQDGFTISNVLGYLHSSYIQLIPIAGWNIAVIHLIFTGPTVINVIGSVLLGITTVIFFLVARNMKCTGAYYEDAMKFADDYAQARAKSKKGEIAILGAKKKYKDSQITYKGNFAKAIFYRQLLEYKKNRFFIFGFSTCICLVISIVLIIALRGEKLPVGKEFIIPGVMAYYVFITSGYMTKWKKELQNPYTYLIPDTAFKKLWYSTEIEHIKAVIDGILIAVPAGIFMRMTPIQILLCVVIFVCLQACKLYITVLGEGIFGNTIGNFPKQILKLFLLGLVVGLGALPAVLGTVFVNIEVGFLGMIAMIVLVTFGIMELSSKTFSRMESVDN